MTRLRSRDARREFDYVVVGGGSAGCAVAARLAATSASVLLLEAGPRADRWEFWVPAAYARRFKTEHDWNVTAEPDPAVGGRSLYFPRAKVLGGCSAMNAMIYLRGSPADYDGWAAGGLPQWSFARVLPYFLRAEDNERGASAFHATGGPLRVSEQRERGALSRAFVDAGVEAGLTFNDDFNGATQDGVGWFQVTQRKGRRHSSAAAYLRGPRRGGPTVRTGAQVLRVNLDRGRATGVRYVAGGRLHEAHAAREVIICAGAVGSPQLLMVSGIGPADELRDLSVRVRVGLPGVGENLQDHPSVGLVWTSSTSSLGTADTPGNLLRYLLFRRGPFVSNIVEAGALLRTRPALPAPDLQLHFAPVPVLGDGLEKPVGDGFVIWATLLTPASRGRVRLRSSDPRAQPIVEAGYLREPADLEVLRDGARVALDLAAQPALARHVVDRLQPGDTSEEDLGRFVRDEARSIHHLAGTCAMGQVVDEQLRVYGVTGLRVADASVMPVIPRANTNAPTIMIGERAADFISGSHPAAARPRAGTAEVADHR